MTDTANLSQTTSKNLSFSEHERDSTNYFINRSSFSIWFEKLVNQRAIQSEKKPFAIFLLDPGLAKLDVIDESNIDLLEAHLWQQLRSFEQHGFVVASFSLNRFVLVLPELEDVDFVVQIAEQIVYMVSSPLLVFGEEFVLNPALGVAHFPLHGKTSTDLISAAKTALVATSNSGRGLAVFDHALGSQAQKDVQLKKHLENALHEFINFIQAEDDLMLFDTPSSEKFNNPFKIVYSPIVHIQKGRIDILESFLVWQDSDGKIYISEEIFSMLSNQIHADKLLQWWWRQTCQYYKIKLPEFGMHTKVMLKFKKIQAYQRNFMSWFQSFIRDEGLNTEQIVLGINEKLFLEAQPNFFEDLKAVAQQDIQVVIQDFGAGGINLSHLQEYPLHYIQVDPEFVQDIHVNPNHYAMIRSILSIANWLNIPIMVPGVDSEEQSSLLMRDRCYLQSGSWFSGFLPSALLDVSLKDPVFQSKLQRTQSSDDEATILLLDDEQNVLSALRRLLRRENYKIFSTTDPQEAFSILALNRIDVIISDQRMPTMTGTEFLSKVKDLYPSTIRIVLSGYTELQSVTDAINQGAIYKFLTKPWDDDQLLANVREAFRRLYIEKENSKLQEALEKANLQLININEQLELQLRFRLPKVERELEKLDVSYEILQHLPWPVLSISVDHKLILINQAAQTWLEKPSNLLIGQPVDDVLPQPIPEVFALFSDSHELRLSWKGVQSNHSKIFLQRLGDDNQPHGILMVVQFDSESI